MKDGIIMRIKVKHVLLFIIVSMTIMSFTIYNILISNDVYEEVDNRNIINNKLISLMIEETRGSGVYKVSKDNKWPSKKYIFNETLSNCKNGSTLTWNENDNSVTVNVNKTDKCDVYFDVEPADITIKPLNLPTTYGKLGSINCSNSDATYNQKYNRIEVSNINTKYENCNLNYTDSSSKANLADYIIGLAGTTQGTGQVVNEKVKVDNSTFTAGAILEQSGYTVSSNDATYPFEWDNTNKTWTSTNHTNNKTATFEFKVATTGYYQVCYKQSSESKYDYAIFYKDDIQVKSLKEISNSDFECYYLGNITTSNVMKVTYQKDLTGSSGSDNVVFYLQSGTYNENFQYVSIGFRYEGANPNNYIWFNNEYWRIIGVFDSASHGQNGNNLVKIIRDDVLGWLGWDKSNSTDWTEASLNKLINGAYYNAQDGTNSGYCYGNYIESLTTNCDYTKKGIQSGYRGMIANVTWYLGGSSSDDATAEEFYGYERGTTVPSGKPTSTTGYIGLMYASDYGYSVLSSSCARTTILSSYNSATCAGKSWLYGKAEEKTLSYTFTTTTSVSVIGLENDGSIGYGDNAIRPVLYLDASVYKLDGNGSLNSPYIIGM